ncbi:MAG: GDP-L-fucose synthase, partial [Gammaproteobacteria bacterium]|nr:GDP-L-fucose synthase [Gammaproteobacteria bacterium]
MGANELTPDSRIFVAGHRGMVGAAIVRQLKRNGFNNIVSRTHAELDLVSQAAVSHFFETEKIDCVISAAARVGGIHANNEYPAEFIYQNLMIEANLIHEAYRAGIQRLLFLGSSCIYPKFAEQPMSEAALLTGELESTNEPYAIAKIAGIKMCESYNRQYGTDYRSIMPTNLYGPGDNFHPQNSHVIPALIRRFHDARLANKPTVTIWGTGTPKREFLHVDDLASASIYLLLLDKASYNQESSPMLSHVNVGTGEDVTIRELAELISGAVGYGGELEFD